MAISPRNDDLTAGLAGQRSETFNAADPLLVTGDVPPQMSYPYPMGADTVLPARTVVALDGAGNIIVAESGSVAGVKATGTITFSGVGTAADTVTIGGRVYTLVVALTGAADEVMIGASATATAQALKNAINGDEATLDVTHGATTDHPSVAASGAAAAILLTANAAGVGGNSVTTVESGTGASFGAATLTGGADEASTAPRAIGFTKYAANNAGGAAGAVRVEVTRWGCFNPDALVWDASYDTLTKKLYAFEGAPSPTSIIIRQPTTMTV
jgi:hypothetical protein